MDIILHAVRILCQILVVAIIFRAILSWVSPMSRNALTDILYRLTDPVIEPIRRVLPRAGMFDFSLLVAIILLQLLVYLTYWLS